MAEEQNLPKEEDVKKEVKAETSDVEIEIKDDTPEADQNRKNLPKELVDKLESEELDAYDEQVKDKIYQLKKVWHDERREKERYQRENQEAINAAKKLLEENGIFIIVKSCNIEYKKPAKLEDQLELKSSIISISNTSFKMRQNAFINNELITDCEIHLVIVDKKGKPSKIPEILKKNLEN